MMRKITEREREGKERVKIHTEKPIEISNYLVPLNPSAPPCSVHRERPGPK